MSKAEILAELPRLRPEDRAQLLDRLRELEEEDHVRGVGPTANEKTVLDAAWAEFERDGDPGRPWRDVLNDIRSRARGETSPPTAG